VRTGGWQSNGRNVSHGRLWIYRLFKTRALRTADCDFKALLDGTEELHSSVTDTLSFKEDALTVGFDVAELSATGGSARVHRSL